jgi:beta-galactosidase
MREIVGLNDGWRYREGFEESAKTPQADIGSWTCVDLPHTSRELPYNCFDEKTYQFVSSYARDIEIGRGAERKRVFLDFEGVACACELWLNGEIVCSHLGGYTPFSVELTGRLRTGANRLVVKVDSTENPDIPPFGHAVDYLCYGGIYREAWLRFQDDDYISDLFAMPQRIMEATKELRVLVEADCPRGESGLDIRCALREVGPGFGRAEPRSSGAVLAISASVPLSPARGGGPARAELWMEGLGGIRNWDVTDPALYELETILSRDGRVVDRVCARVGFREAAFRPQGFFLNGRRLPLVGLNRHQSYPYVGYAMPGRVQRRDAEMLKRELGLNIVRASHYPPSRHFLDACDELGLLVFEELPGWQHIGGRRWQDVACASLQEMIRRDRNRPSIVLWGVRINESKDDRDFYARTNEIAHRLDPTRQTGGVRDFAKSALLEDVYTYNDFLHSGGKKTLSDPRRVAGSGRAVPYLVTEHSGHMFPTKRIDCEERLAEHALRHARVLDAALSMPGVSGAIGWCAFDYNTHKDFGSGDRVCYHGVSDMFRIPKYAAALYASQADPAQIGPVLVAASLFAKGERSAARLLPIEVYTNCDEVLLYRSGERVGAFRPDRAAFPRLPHPPVVIGDLIGDRLGEGRFRARDADLLRRLVGKVFSEGFDSLGPLDLARFGLFLKRYGMSREDAVSLIAKYTMAWGQEDDIFELVGTLGGEEVIRRSYGADSRYESLDMKADDDALSAAPGSGWDSTRIVLRALDQYGNICPFVAECVELAVQGPARILGPARVPLIGGCIAFWVRTMGEIGHVRVFASGTRLAAVPVDLEIGRPTNSALR